MSAPARAHAPGSAEHHSIPERVLLALGADPDVVEAVIGDIIEEYTVLRERRGDALARLWVAQEAGRSLPPFVWRAMRHGSPTVRARIAAVVAGGALIATMVVVAMLSRNGPPARLVADVGEGAEAVIVNSSRPVQLQTQAVDERGRRVSSQGVQFRWARGVPATITPTGVLTCTHDGDLTVRASLGAVSTDIGVSCRRVVGMRASSWIDMVEGDPARSLPYEATGAYGQRITELRGQVYVIDSSVATLSGVNIRPRAVGRTLVDVLVGDRRAEMLVTVHQRVRALDDLRSEQLYVAVPVRLARGDTVRFALPREAFWLAYLPQQPGDAPPTIVLDGSITCSRGDAMHQYLTPLDEPRLYCIAHSAGGGVTLAHGLGGAPVVAGSLIFERVDHWRLPQ